MRKKQGGATIWVNLIWIMMGVVIAIFSVKVIPIYLDNYTVAGSLEGLKAEEGLSKLKDREIRRKLSDFFTINNVRTISPDQIVIEREKRKLVAIKVDYEVREHLFYNIDLMLKFENRLEAKDIR